MTTESDVPQLLATVFEETAERMCRSFEKVGFLSGQHEAPMPERNTVVHLASVLLGNGFAVYAEPRLEEERKERIDLLAYSHGLGVVLLFEVKTFGNVKFDSVLSDAKRLDVFCPAVARRKDENQTRFWHESSSRGGHWACVIIQNFRQAARDAWQQTGKNNGLKGNQKHSFGELAALFREKGAHRSKTPVLSENEIWPDTGAMDLLWGAWQPGGAGSQSA